MAKDGASITVDPSEFIAGLNMADDRVRQGAYDGMNTNRLDLEKEAKRLVPIDIGTLQNSGVSNAPKWRGNEISAEIGFNTFYATEVHETMAPAITTKPKQPGPTTRARPTTQFGEAGGKYLERPMHGKARSYTKVIADRIKRRLK